VLGGLLENIFQYPFGVSSEFVKHLFTCLNSYTRQMPFDWVRYVSQFLLEALGTLKWL